jgi:hypothetical protein
MAYLITDYGKYQEPMKKIMSVHKPPISKDWESKTNPD